jgi:prepilin-type N-terminal cleavage/methylation domain-containing protein/prepilin-type processing-associated H-X9-DG protein
MNRRSGFTLVEMLVVIGILSVLSALLFPVFAQARGQARLAVCTNNAGQLSLGVMLYSQDWDEALPTLGIIREGRGRWMWQIRAYLKNNEVFTCPLVPRNRYNGTRWTDQTGFGWAEHLWGRNLYTRAADGYRLSEINKPAETIAIGDTGFDGMAGWAMYRQPQQSMSGDWHPGYFPQFRHQNTGNRPFWDKLFQVTRHIPTGGRCSFVFLDGHAKSFTSDRAFQPDNERGNAYPYLTRYRYWNR